MIETDMEWADAVNLLMQNKVGLAAAEAAVKQAKAEGIARITIDGKRGLVEYYDGLFHVISY